MKPRCPICKKSYQNDNNKYFPFCSSRCRLADLGDWLDGKYRISEPTREEANEKR
ncbi:DNA gyrase inhibitor YacG [candidate division NPL-UPA2 bacterium Unc8]|uniref:DNA gyrase inhibitor YacG n=1 Tax=candidate division NPL-UPA2 bacterium Unc8 TaxID=1980939 RepID=A0A399FY24_UNCN2|nr:MAG: DNA gyrase inhibitor YacG [candidate division NPL-UPA2 bacterium Unc8]